MPLQILFKDVRLYKIGAPPTPVHCLPLGDAPAESHETQLVAMKLQADLLHTCFAVTTAPAGWWEPPKGKDAPKIKGTDVLKLSVAGFVSIQEVDLEERTITVLSTVQHQHMLPERPCTLLLAEQRYSDAAEL